MHLAKVYVALNMLYETGRPVVSYWTWWLFMSIRQCCNKLHTKVESQKNDTRASPPTIHPSHHAVFGVQPPKPPVSVSSPGGRTMPEAVCSTVVFSGPSPSLCSIKPLLWEPKICHLRVELVYLLFTQPPHENDHSMLVVVPTSAVFNFPNGFKMTG